MGQHTHVESAPTTVARLLVSQWDACEMGGDCCSGILFIYATWTPPFGVGWKKLVERWGQPPYSSPDPGSGGKTWWWLTHGCEQVSKRGLVLTEDGIEVHRYDPHGAHGGELPGKGSRRVEPARGKVPPTLSCWGNVGVERGALTCTSECTCGSVLGATVEVYGGEEVDILQCICYKFTSHATKQRLLTGNVTEHRDRIHISGT